MWETLVSVHGRFPIARHALLTLLGCRRTPRHAGAKKKFLNMLKTFSSVQRLSNVWVKRSLIVHRSLYKRYEIVHFVRLSLFMRLVCVRKTWQSFVIYLACYQRVIGALSASTERLQNDCITSWWRPHNALSDALALANRSQNVQVQLG